MVEFEEFTIIRNGDHIRYNSLFNYEYFLLKQTKQPRIARGCLTINHVSYQDWANIQYCCIFSELMTTSLSSTCTYFTPFITISDPFLLISVAGNKFNRTKKETQFVCGRAQKTNQRMLDDLLETNQTNNGHLITATSICGYLHGSTLNNHIYK